VILLPIGSGRKAGRTIAAPLILSKYGQFTLNGIANYYRWTEHIAWVAGDPDFS
jgi:hypothetical protein